MLSPSRGPERLVRLGQWLIALLFAYFLIQVGGSLIADLPLLSQRPQQERFLDPARVGQLQRQQQPLQQRRDQLQEEIQRHTERQLLAGQAVEREKTSFETWRAARSATEQSQQNPEVIARARQLDRLLQQQQQLSDEGSRLEAQLQGAQKDLLPIEEQLEQLRRQDRCWPLPSGSSVATAPATSGRSCGAFCCSGCSPSLWSWCPTCPASAPTSATASAPCSPSWWADR
jgi:hypothetical protein